MRLLSNVVCRHKNAVAEFREVGPSPRDNAQQHHVMTVIMRVRPTDYRSRNEDVVLLRV